MIERGCGQRLPSQPLARAGVGGGGGGEQLDRDLAIETWIAGAVHLTHSSCAKPGDDFIGSDARAGGERQKRQATPMLLRQAFLRGDEVFLAGGSSGVGRNCVGPERFRQG